MPNTFDAQEACERAHDFFIERGRRCVGYVKRKAQERKAKRESETSQDRAARRTSDATYWIAGFTLLSIFVNFAVWGVLKSQLDEMKAQRLTTIAQIRANVQLERTEMHPIKNGWEVNPIIKINGATDGNHFVVWWAIVPEKIPASTGGLINIKCPEPNKMEKIAPSTVSAGREMPLISKRIDLSDVTDASGPKPSKIILIVGHAEYIDVFPGTPLHHLDWCIIAQPIDAAKNTWSMPLINYQAD